MEQKTNRNRPKHTGRGSVLLIKKSLKQHTAGQHHKRFLCGNCDLSFHFASSLRRHQTVHFDLKELKCTRCEYVSARKCDLARHMNKHDLKNEHSSSTQLTDELITRTSPKMSLSRRSTLVALKDVETRSIRRLRAMSFKRGNRLPDIENLPKGFRRKIEVGNDCKGQEPADRKKRNSVKKLESRYNLRQKNVSDSVNCVDIEMGSDATCHVPVVRIDQPSSSLSHPDWTTPSLRLNSIYEEARQLRSQISLSTTLSTVLSRLERLLELAASITKEIRGSVAVEVRSQAAECFDYVWCASKMAVCRWEDMQGSIENDSFLKAVRYAYKTLPIFIKWDKGNHFEMVEHVILLSINTVKNCQLQPSLIPLVVKKEPIISVQRIVDLPSQSSSSAKIAEDKKNQKVKVVPIVAKEVIKKEILPPADLQEEKNLHATLEFCRLANIATWQNTKERNASGFKDDSGVYHPMYRYETRKMLSLYCPAHVTQLKCCGKVYGLAGLKAHVSKHHEAGQPKRTEPSISPL